MSERRLPLEWKKRHLSWEASSPLPLYEYRCTKCGFHFEKIQHFDSEPETECPKCHGALMRPLTAPALQFKGAGWYVNDYASKGSSGSSEDKPSEPGAAAPAKSKAGAAESSANTSSEPGPSKAASADSTAKPASPPSSSSE
jgi:putative FmdB family regulatory protein